MILRLTAGLIACAVALAAADKHTILAVFAHPDDETVVGPLLAKYADEGHQVRLVTITSGQIGSANTDIPKGDELGAAREAEARCSCRALGIPEPFLLQFMDGGISAHLEIEAIITRLREIFNEVKPDVVITWGPDGLTGHPDHRTASNVTTQVFQQRAQLQHRPRKLYYAAWPESRMRDLPEPFNRPGAVRAVSDEFVTTEVDAAPYVEAAYQSVQCHKTQWTPEQMARNHELMQRVLAGKIFLRLALSDPPLPREREHDVFAGLQ